MLSAVLAKSDFFRTKAATRRLKNLLPKYKIRESQKLIRRLTGKSQDPPSPEKSHPEEKSVENFLIRKKLLSKCSSKRARLRTNLINGFFKSIVGNVREDLRMCLDKLRRGDALSEAPSEGLSLGEAPSEGMPKIEETFEESVEDSRLESPIRKATQHNLIVDSHVFDLKLSKIQKAGEEHRFIETGPFNFTTNETGRTHQTRGTSTLTTPTSTSASKTPSTSTLNSSQRRPNWTSSTK